MSQQVQLTVDDFEEWKENMVTQTIHARIKKTILDLKSGRSDRLESNLGLFGNDKFQAEQKLVFESGVIASLEDMLDLTFEDIS